MVWFCSVPNKPMIEIYGFQLVSFIISYRTLNMWSLGGGVNNWSGPQIWYPPASSATWSAMLKGPLLYSIATIASLSQFPEIPLKLWAKISLSTFKSWLSDI